MLKEKLLEIAGGLESLEKHARRLQNQNFADIVASAHRRVTQLTEHPDLAAVEALLEGHEAGDEQPSQSAPFPGS